MKEQGWIFVSEDDREYMMCKNGIKTSISKGPVKQVLGGVERHIFSVSMEFNSGTENFCRRKAH